MHQECTANALCQYDCTASTQQTSTRSYICIRLSMHHVLHACPSPHALGVTGPSCIMSTGRAYLHGVQPEQLLVHAPSNRHPIVLRLCRHGWDGPGCTADLGAYGFAGCIATCRVSNIAAAAAAAAAKAALCYVTVIQAGGHHLDTSLRPRKGVRRVRVLVTKGVDALLRSSGQVVVRGRRVPGGNEARQADEERHQLRGSQVRQALP
eukprot:scaffold50553_cov21-Tisochrysis_lutea.AAC.1